MVWGHPGAQTENQKLRLSPGVEAEEVNKKAERHEETSQLKCRNRQKAEGKGRKGK
jgi:hypothetical protein